MNGVPDPRARWLAAGAGLLVVALVASGIRPFDRGTWLLEVFPVLIVIPVLWMTHARHPLTTLLYALVFVHARLERNPYDRIGHFLQGLVPGLAAREILIRGGHVRGRRMLGFIVLCIALAISAAYELVEWATALMLGQGADDFLGTQGDPWDTQSDMFCALLGAATALLAFSRLQDRQIERTPWR